MLLLRLCLFGSCVCLFALGQSQPLVATQFGLCKVENRLEVLPGRGWDSLRNKEMGQVLALSYARCKSTEDGQYLLPDHVSTIPIKKSDMALTSEFIEHYSNYSSITSKSFKAEASGSFGGIVSVSGSFSSEYQTVRQHQVDDKSITTRVHLRNTVYSVLAEPFAEVDSDLKKLVMDVAQEIEKNNTDKAQFLLELIVRDYGTHYVSRIDAGAILAQEEFLSDKFMQSFSGDRSKISASASASFMSNFKIDASYTESVDQQTYQSYKKSLTATYMRVYGGCLLEPNMTVHQWVSKISNNLVAIDRSGEPLSYIITPMKFGEISLSTLGRLRLMLDNAISAYYSYNTHVGCMNMDSPNFEFNANVEDQSCHSPYNNYTFGGVFQVCNIDKPSWFRKHGDLCDSLTQANPVTGKQSCPPGYSAIPLIGASSQRVTCDRYWFWWVCASVEFQSFWCAATGAVAADHGVMFGGVFSDSTNNPVTQSKSCPFTYYPLRIGTNLKVCVSNDYELGFRYSIPFGGFFSCTQGNPLAIAGKTVKSSYSSSNSPYPPGCPGGYSQHMAIIDNNCEINYCVKANVFSGHGQMPIFRPPFKDLSSLYVDKMAVLTSYSEPDSMSGGSIAGIVIGTFVAIVVVTLGIVWWRRQRKSHSSSGSNEQEPLLPERSQYEEVNDSLSPTDSHLHSVNVSQDGSSNA